MNNDDNVTERRFFYIYVYFDPRKNPPEPIYVGKEHDNRGSEKCKGQKRSEETKAKMRLAWERRRQTRV